MGVVVGGGGYCVDCTWLTTARRSVVQSFLHVCDIGHSTESTPKADVHNFLFPNALWILGWDHLWAGVVDVSFNSLRKLAETLVKMRKMTKFMAFKTHRDMFAQWLASCGLQADADCIGQRLSGSFLHLAVEHTRHNACIPFAG